MKSCNGCKYAQWSKTKNGSLHPSGDGKCEFVYMLNPLPNAWHWSGFTPRLSDGYINRRREYDTHCVYWSRYSDFKEGNDAAR